MRYSCKFKITVFVKKVTNKISWKEFNYFIFYSTAKNPRKYVAIDSKF